MIVMTKPVYFNGELLCYIRLYGDKRQFKWPGDDRQWLNADGPIGNKANLPHHTLVKVRKMEHAFRQMEG